MFRERNIDIDKANQPYLIIGNIHCAFVTL